jgi:hypothetical protein
MKTHLFVSKKIDVFIVALISFDPTRRTGHLFYLDFNPTISMEDVHPKRSL